MPENLPALVQGTPSVTKIICPAREARLIAESDQLKALRQIVPVKFLIQPPTEEDAHEHSYERFSAYYKTALRDDDVIAGETAFVFLTPDGIYGNGSFKRVREICDAGYKAVLIPGPRVVKETFLMEYYPTLKPSGGVPMFANRDLVHLFLRHTHRITKSYFVNDDQPYFSTQPAQLYWRVGDEGLIYRAFVYHPLVVRPDYRVLDVPGTIDWLLVQLSISTLNNIYICRDSDEIFGVDLAPYSYDQGQIAYRRHSQRRMRRRVHRWINSWWVTGYHLWLATHEGRIHVGKQSDAWRCISEESARFINEILTKERFERGGVEGVTYSKLVDPWRLAKRSGVHVPPPHRSVAQRILDTRLMRGMRRLYRYVVGKKRINVGRQAEDVHSMSRYERRIERLLNEGKTPIEDEGDSALR